MTLCRGRTWRTEPAHAERTISSAGTAAEGTPDVTPLKCFCPAAPPLPGLLPLPLAAFALAPGVAMFAFDLNMTIVLVEGRAIRDVGWDPDQIRGKRPHDTLSLAELRNVLPLYEAALRGERVSTHFCSVQGRAPGTSFMAFAAPIHDEFDEVFGGVIVLFQPETLSAGIASERGDRA